MRQPIAGGWLAAADTSRVHSAHRPTAQASPSTISDWLYPAASNAAPTIATANSVGDISNPTANVANYANGADWNSLNGNVTTVGSVTLVSPPASSAIADSLDG
jgi:hypothetical protein